ncbi:MAG: C40 family peptidase [Bacteroidetes bacterium]|nr:C40 family peptidase [Bacteroidota bacterium]
MNRYNIIFIIGLAAAVFILEGCSGSSPRFRSKEKRTSSAPQKQGPRFSSKEAEEEIKETDKKPGKKEIENIAKGNRDFREEKNEAIKPLDESRMMREISKYMGVSYLHGGLTIEGIDCSGYTMMVYKNSLNIQLPRSSYDQSKSGKPVELSELKFGDLIFFNTTGENASHVGIYLGDDLFAHASVSLGVTISSLQSSYYEKRFECARRIVKQ